MSVAQMIFLAVIGYAVALVAVGAWRARPGWRGMGAFTWFFNGFLIPSGLLGIALSLTTIYRGLGTPS